MAGVKGDRRMGGGPYLHLGQGHVIRTGWRGQPLPATISQGYISPRDEGVISWQRGGSQKKGVAVYQYFPGLITPCGVAGVSLGHRYAIGSYQMHEEGTVPLQRCQRPPGQKQRQWPIGVYRPLLQAIADQLHHIAHSYIEGADCHVNRSEARVGVGLCAHPLHPWTDHQEGFPQGTKPIGAGLKLGIEIGHDHRPLLHVLIYLSPPQVGERSAPTGVDVADDDIGPLSFHHLKVTQGGEAVPVGEDDSLGWGGLKDFLGVDAGRAIVVQQGKTGIVGQGLRRTEIEDQGDQEREGAGG